MTRKTVETDNPLWRFSLALYGHEDVAAACLRLQDRDGLDVNLVLYCCWAASMGTTLDEGTVAVLSDRATDWQSVVTGQLRGVRRALKDGVSVVAPQDSDPLREAIKALELESERLLQQALWQAVPILPSEEPFDAATLAQANLERYFNVSEAPLSAELVADLRCIANAASALSGA